MYSEGITSVKGVTLRVGSYYKRTQNTRRKSSVGTPGKTISEENLGSIEKG